MNRSVKIPEAELEIVRREAELNSRTVSGQITHWLRIGRAIERSSNFSYARIQAALKGEVSPDALTMGEQDAYLDDLFAASAAGTPEQQRFFADQNARGEGVGLDEKGRIVQGGRSSE